MLVGEDRIINRNLEAISRFSIWFLEYSITGVVVAEELFKESI